MINCMEKYRWLFERDEKVFQQLQLATNRMEIQDKQLAKERTEINYPNSTKRNHQTIMKHYAENLGIEGRAYHHSNNLRLYKKAQKLTGYITKEDEDRLEQIKKEFTPLKLRRPASQLQTSHGNPKIA